MARREQMAPPFRKPGSSIESQERDINPIQSCLRPEVKVREKQNKPASSEFR